MTKKARGFAAFIALALSCGILTAKAENEKTPDMVPMPKVYKEVGGTFDLDNKTIFIPSKNKQCEIAADEIALRIKKLGGSPGKTENPENDSLPGIYILTIKNKGADAFKKKYNLEITEKDPGPQGYIIHTSKDQLIIIGSDNVGALYGAMTLRQMMKKTKDGKVEIAAAKVYDKPDYRYRSSMSFKRGIARWTTGMPAKDQMKAYKAGMDWLMRFKVNIVGDYMFFGTTDIRQANPESKAFLKEINQYAADRGIYPIKWFQTAVANIDVDKEEIDGIRAGRGKKLIYNWARKDLNEKAAKRAAEFVKECNFKMLFLHPLDGGGIQDPELWSRRSKLDKKTYKDDERWKASVDQFNIWADTLKKIAPDVIFTSPIYPYAASYASHERFPGVDEKTWKQNSIDYWEKVNAGLDRMLIPQSWMGQRPLMDKYRRYFSGRPIMIYSHSFVPVGYFGTWHRLNKTNYYGNPDDIFTLNGGFDYFERWLNVICTGEYTWNTNAPGSEYYTGLMYDAEKDHTGPKAIMDEWVPRACKAFYGEEVGKRIVPVYTAGVMPLYIVDPGRGMYLMNKPRRKPLADVDPTKKAEQTLGEAVAPDLQDTPERMAFQVNATKKAMKALEEAYPFIDTMDPYRRKSFMYFYKRMPLWHMIARARHACYVAASLQRQGMFNEAAGVLEAGLKNYEEDWAYAKSILDKTKKEPDLNYFGPLGFKYDGKRGDVKFPPQKVKAMLEERLASAKVILKPRKPGPIVNVAIYKGCGQNGTKAFFDQFKNVKADIIDSLALATIDKYDVVFILQTNSLNKEDYFFNLPRYVKEGGGGVVFQHDQCGFGRNVFGNKTPFPSICPNAAGRKDAWELTVIRECPIVGKMKKGEKMKHMYYDHIIPKVGKDAEIILADKDGEAVLIAGEYGYGKVIFDGNVNLTGQDQDVLLTGINAVAAQGAVEWMTGVKLLKK